MVIEIHQEDEKMPTLEEMEEMIRKAGEEFGKIRENHPLLKRNFTPWLLPSWRNEVYK